MSSIEEAEREASELRREINELLDIDRQELYGVERLGEISFEKHGKEQFERIFSLLEDLKSCNLNRFPPGPILNLRQPIQKCKDLFERAKSLDMKRTDVAPAAERDQIVSELVNCDQELLGQAIPFLALTRQTSAVIKEMEAKSKKYLDLIRASADKSAAEAKKTLDASATVRGFAAKTGTDHNIDRYRDAQEKHANTAKVWLWIVSLVAVLLVATAITYFCIYYGDKDESGVSREFVLGHREVAALLIVVLLLYSIFFCAKNYTSEKHNQVVNNNKANALDTFELFVSSANSEDTKDQVLLVSAMAIFANTSTGFGKDQGMPLPPLMEAVKRGADQNK